MTKPRSLHPLAENILQRLSGFPEASEIVLGGYFALQFYTDYRTTRDIDAWWKTRATHSGEEALRTVMQEVAQASGYELKERSFGETLSFELHRAGAKEFSFQVAVRTIGLEEPVASAWPPILIETLYDNIGSKMNALVNRGAPRDFLDIKRVVGAGLLPVELCWELWKKKNSGESIDSAKHKVHFHLVALEGRRPLETIPGPAERRSAQQTREWFKHEFLNRE